MEEKRKKDIQTAKAKESQQQRELTKLAAARELRDKAQREQDREEKRQRKLQSLWRSTYDKQAMWQAGTQAKSILRKVKSNSRNHQRWSEISDKMGRHLMDTSHTEQPSSYKIVVRAMHELRRFSPEGTLAKTDIKKNLKEHGNFQEFQQGVKFSYIHGHDCHFSECFDLFHFLCVS